MKHSHAFTPAKRRKPLTPALLVQLHEAGMHEPDPFYERN